MKFAIIGQGHIGKRHAEMARNIIDAELTAVCDTLPKEQLGLTDLKEPYYTSIEKMLAAHPEINVVSICTPNGLHTKHSLMVLETNKHVICEKPMALSKTDCEKIIFKAIEKKKTFFV